MTLFIVIAGLLLAIVVAVLLYPLLRSGREHGEAVAGSRELSLAVLREQRTELEREYAEGSLNADAYAKARDELERRALEDGAAVVPEATRSAAKRPLMAALVGVAVPAAVVALYVFLGEPGALSGSKPAATMENGGHAVSPQQIRMMVERLAERLQQNPDDGQGWLMLAKSYSVLGQYPESTAAYGRAVSLLPPDAQVLADFADTVAMAQGRKLQGEPERIVRQALAVDPKNIKALALAGTIAFDRQDYRSAIAEWQKILALVPADSNVAAGIQGSIRDAENRLAMTGGKIESSAKEPIIAGSISGEVVIDRTLAAGAAPGDALFVYAKAVEGPKMPLAILRKTVADLPLSFTLDDTMAMAPNFRLSQFDRVIIGARISKSGDAMPRSGDLEGVSTVVSPGATSVRIQINQKVN